MHTGNISSFWGTAQIIDDDHVLIKRLMPPNYKAKSEQAFLFHVIAWDANCPQHIPQRLDASDVADALEERDRRIAALEAEIAQLKNHQADPSAGHTRG